MVQLVPRFGVTRYEADEFYRIALAAYQKHNLDEAIVNMNHAITLVPNQSEYWAARGFFFFEHGSPDKAAADFDEALRRHPYEMLANYGRGMLAYRAKDWTQAKEYFTKAWAVMPERAETLYYLALIHHRLEDNRQAMTWMQQALDAFERLHERTAIQNAERWLQEFAKLQERQQALQATTKHPSSLPEAATS